MKRKSRLSGTWFHTVQVQSETSPQLLKFFDGRLLNMVKKQQHKKNLSQNEDFASSEIPSVTLVSFGCCVL